MQKMVIEGDGIGLQGGVWVDHRKPGSIFQVNGDCGDGGKENIMILQDLFVNGRSKEMHHAFWYKYAILVIMTHSGHSSEEFSQQFDVAGCTFYSKDVHLHLCRFSAVTEVHPVNFEFREDGNKVVTV